MPERAHPHSSIRRVESGAHGPVCGGQQRVDLLLQARLGLVHVLVAHRLVLAGIRFNFAFVDGHLAQLYQSGFRTQPHCLREQPGERLQTTFAELGDGCVVRVLLIRQLNTVTVPHRFPRLLRERVGKQSHSFLAGSIVAGKITEGNVREGARLNLPRTVDAPRGAARQQADHRLRRHYHLPIATA